MTRKIFIWVAHPKPGSLSAALADAYEKGAAARGAEIRRMDLAGMSFDPAFEGYGADPRALEPDLLQWRENLAWAEHVLLLHPYWWGAMPARAKAVLDRALTSGFAFRYHDRGMGWDKLLTGRTADTFITSDTPPWLDVLLYRKPGRRVLRNQVLGFCGIRTRRQVQFGPVKLADPGKIAGWLGRAESLGRSAA
ncbi:flavodoxin family protein [Roseovarius sp. TE539]|uniref:NAD(P)H-dependent oxidoreductase n=1 Tax=Roseovarius sp. TE539 TaxID=2249812 RepID=UPI000DDCA2D9|nr:NAD(P)H-dependent oxidoreductase [Roseovarius sp. TE539]RBI76978.1 flavodoxin family protein [Roseovarius sp. TE539]